MPTLKDELGKRNPFDNPAEEVYLNLLRTVSVLEARIAPIFKQHGLSESTYNILRILRGHSLAENADPAGIPCQTIGDQLVSRLPDVTRLVDRLEAAGLVRRSRTAEDRRLVLVAITRKGLDLLAKLDAPLSALNQNSLSHLTPSEQTELSRLLYKARHPESAQ